MNYPRSKRDGKIWIILFLYEIIMQKNCKLHLGFGIRVKKMRDTWISFKDISKITWCPVRTIESRIYWTIKWKWYTVYEMQDENVKTYIKNLFDRIQSVLHFSDKNLVEYIANKYWDLYTQLWIIEYKINHWNTEDLKENILKKGKLLKQLHWE